MRQNGLVILTPILPDQVASLRELLAAKIDPDWDSDKGQTCRDAMRFDRLHMLHFACFAVLVDPEGIDAMEPCLLLEATIDGDRQDFLDELIALCGNGLDIIYSHCKGYPASGHRLPHLVKSYLNGHAVAPHIEFQGHPGRSLAEIHGEDALRQHLVKQLESYTNFASSFSGARSTILREIRRQVAGHPDFQWSMEERAEPFETAHGRRLTVFAGVLLVALIGIIAIVLSGPDSGTYFDCLLQTDQPATGCRSAYAHGWAGDVIAVVGRLPYDWGGWVVGPLPLGGGLLRAAITLIVAWFLARFVQYLAEVREKPASAGVRWMLRQAVRRSAQLLRYLALAALIALGLRHVGEPASLDWIAGEGLRAAVAVLLVIVGGLPVVLLIRYIRSMPSLQGRARHVPAHTRANYSLLSDLLWLGMAVLIWFILLAFDWLTGLPSGLPGYAVIATWFVTGAIGLFIVLATLLVLLVLWLLSIWVRERLIDDKLYDSAERFTMYAVDPQRFARESHGVNKGQNHLISLSRIKPGQLRLWRLRLVTLVVNIMCKWWFTRGELGDVRDIHFLRWIIIDRGRRLLFLDTYQGSWSGYLDAFIDSGSLHALNAIWSHTYQRIAGAPRPIGFPRTKCMIWDGARDEPPFKAAVRASQRETIVWYSAYPAIGGANIIANSKIRNDLFRRLDTSEMEALISRIQ